MLWRDNHMQTISNMPTERQVSAPCTPRTSRVRERSAQREPTRTARNPVRCSECLEKLLCVYINTLLPKPESGNRNAGEDWGEKKTEHEILVDISRGRRGKGARVRSARLHGTVNPSGVCKEAERRGAHWRGGETLTH